MLPPDMRGKKLSPEARENVVKSYETGSNFDEIEESLGVSKSSQSGIINERAKIDPDIYATHDLARYMRKNNVTKETLVKGADAVSKCDKAGVELDFVLGVIPFFEKVPKEEDQMNYCKLGSEYFELLETSGGKSPEEMLEETKEIVQERDRAREDLEKFRSENKEIEKEIRSKQSTLNDLDQLGQIHMSLKKQRRGAKEAAKVVSEMEKVLERGLTPEVCEDFSKEIQKRGGNPREAAKEIAKIYAEYGGLQDKVQSLKTETERLSSKKESLQAEVASREGRVKFLDGQINTKTNDLDGLRDEEKLFVARHESAEKEFERKHSEKIAGWKREEESHQLKILSLKSQIKTLEGIKSSLETEISAAKILWNFVLKHNSALRKEIFPLTYRSPEMLEMPLSEQAREFLKSGLAKLLTRDDKKRMKLEEEKFERAKKENESKIKKLLSIRDDLAGQVEYFKTLQVHSTLTPEAAREMGEKILADQNFYRAFFSAKDKVIVNAFARLKAAELVRIQKLLGLARKEAARIAEERFIGFMNPYAQGGWFL